MKLNNNIRWKLKWKSKNYLGTCIGEESKNCLVFCVVRVLQIQERLGKWNWLKEVKSVFINKA